MFEQLAGPGSLAAFNEGPDQVVDRDHGQLGIAGGIDQGESLDEERDCLLDIEGIVGGIGFADQGASCRVPVPFSLIDGVHRVEQLARLIEAALVGVKGRGQVHEARQEQGIAGPLRSSNGRVGKIGFGAREIVRDPSGVAQLRQGAGLEIGERGSSQKAGVEPFCQRHGQRGGH